MACTPTSEFNITQLSLHSDPLFAAASVLLAGAGVQPHGLNPDASGVDTIRTARGGRVHPSIRTHAERSGAVGRRCTGDTHGGGLNEINDFPLGFAVALDVPLCRLDTVMPD